MFTLRPVGLAFLCVAILSACGSEDGASEKAQPEATTTAQEAPVTTDASTTTRSPETTTTTTPSNTVADGDLLFVECPGSLKVLSPSGGTPKSITSGLKWFCDGNGYVQENIRVSRSGRYAVSFVGSGTADLMEIVDIENGSSKLIDQAALASWAASHTGSGLDASTPELSIVGFDDRDDGTVFFSNNFGQVSSFEQNEFLSQPLSSLSGGSLNPAALTNPSPCSISWSRSPDGAVCPNSKREGLVVASDSLTDGLSKHKLGCFWDNRYAWLDSNRIAFVDTYGRKAQVGDVAADSCSDVYTVSGDRNILLFGVANETIFVSSPKLDQSGTEVFGIPAAGGEPTLLTTIAGDGGKVFGIPR